MAEAKPVTLYCVNACVVDGEHVAVGTVLKNIEAELAKELTGAGRTRLATPEEAANKPGARSRVAEAA